MRWVTSFVSLLLAMAFVFLLFDEVSRADKNADAQKILNTAITLYSSVPGSSDGEKYVLMLEVRTLFDRIVTEHPSGDLAMQIERGETVGPINITEVDLVLASVAETPPPDAHGPVSEPNAAAPISEPIISEPVDSTQSDGGVDADTPFTDQMDAERAEVEMALDRSQRREIQRRLTLLGQDTKGVDGVFGPGTRNAIANWQTTQGMPATGFLDSNQREILVDETQTAYANWQVEAARQARHSRLISSSEPTPNGRYIGSDGCLREANGLRVPYFSMKCDFRGAIKLK